MPIPRESPGRAIHVKVIRNTQMFHVFSPEYIIVVIVYIPRTNLALFLVEEYLPYDHEREL